MNNSPKFFCVGAQKCATTSLYEILKQHPEIGVPKFKEPNFFSINENYYLGIDWYMKTYFPDLQGKTIWGEFTPIYFYHPLVPKRINEEYGGDVQFIVMLRDPVDRAYSQYLHNVRDSLEPESFEVALAKEDSRLARCPISKQTGHHTRLAYRGMSSYASCLARYLEFFPIESFFFIILEDDFYQNRPETILRLLDFLGVNANVRLDIEIHKNPASSPRFKGLKKLLYGKNALRDVAKQLVPSAYLRQIIKRKINRLNNAPGEKVALSPAAKAQLRTSYFDNEISEFEKLVGRSLENWRQ